VLRVFEATEREAERYGHQHIGTEHLLLGLLAEPDGIAARVLVELGETTTVGGPPAGKAQSSWYSALKGCF